MLACARAAVANSVVATATAAIPRLSNFVVSCKLHVVHDPQSARASMTPAQSALTSCSITSAGAGLVKVGFITRTTFVTP